MAEPESRTRKDPTLSAFATRKLGRYELLTQIGKGGMAEVHLAMQRGLGGFEKLVVIKLVHEHLASKKAFVDMLLDEGRLAGMIKHPNVIDIYDLGDADGRCYVAMEYLDGEPLLAILRRGVEGERLDPLSTARVIADTAEGLEAAHRLKSLDGKPLGLIHHDVSLGNIVVLYNGQVKLVDFGVAKARAHSTGKQELVQGKFGYMAPEKLKEGAEVDRRSDIWSLGVVAWEALTLQRLFKAKTDAETMQMVLELEIPPPSKVNPDVPAELDPIILRALERDPEKRVSTAKGLSLDLESVLRKKGYAGKNDRIAAYMERTFAEQIEVREKLVAELSAGATSKATIAAFAKAANDTAQPATPVPGTIQPEVSDGIPSHPDLAAEAAAAAVRSTNREEDPSVARKRDSIRDIQEWLDGERRYRGMPWWQRYAPYLAGGGVLLVLVLIVVKCSGSKPDTATRSADAATRTAVTPPAPPPPEPKPTPPPPANEPGIDLRGGADEPPPATPSLAEPPPVAAPPVAEPPPKPAKPVTPPAKPVTKPTPKPTTAATKPTTKPATTPTANNAAGFTRLGMDQLRRSDGDGAVSSFTQATKLDSSYAPAWYGLGRAYEVIGLRRGPVKAAYQRYLSLAPSGQYATDARARIERL